MKKGAGEKESKLGRTVVLLTLEDRKKERESEFLTLFRDMFHVQVFYQYQKWFSVSLAVVIFLCVS